MEKKDMNSLLIHLNNYDIDDFFKSVSNLDE